MFYGKIFPRHILPTRELMMIKAGPNVVLEQRAIIIITVITIRDSYLYWEGGEKGRGA